MTAALSLSRRTLRIFGEWASVVTLWAGSFLMYGISLLPSGSSPDGGTDGIAAGLVPGAGRQQESCAFLGQFGTYPMGNADLRSLWTDKKQTQI